MADRYTALRDELKDSHLPLTIQAQNDQERILIFKTMTVRELRQEVIARFAHEAGKGDYMLTVNGQALKLHESVAKLAPGTVVRLERVQRQQALTDLQVALVVEGQMFAFPQLPAMIGRSKEYQAEMVAWLTAHADGMSVSRKHAELTKQGDEYLLRNVTNSPAEKPIIINEGGENPVIINSDIPKTVTDGDTIRLGKITFTLSIKAR